MTRIQMKIIRELKITEKQRKIYRKIIRVIDDFKELKLFYRINKTGEYITIYSNIYESFVLVATWIKFHDFSILEFDVSGLNYKFFNFMKNVMYSLENENTSIRKI